MPEDKPPMPPQPPTTQIPKADIMEALLRSLQTTVADGFREMKADIGLVANDVSLVKDRVSGLERWRDESEKRQDNSSIRAKQTSVTDDGQNVQLAALTAQIGTLGEAHAEHAEVMQLRVKELEDTFLKSNAAQTVLIKSIVEKGQAFLSRPEVKYIAAALWTALVAYLARKGIVLQ